MMDGARVLFYTGADLVTALHASLNKEAEERTPEFIERLKDVSVLVIDDLGLGEGRDWVDSQIETILHSRAMREYDTLITTNLDGIKSERITSRMSDRTLCKLVVCDGVRDVRPLLRPEEAKGAP
jgi:DNA replication protein DnaC